MTHGYYARTTDPETSHTAQDAIEGISELQSNILTVFQCSSTPLTDDRLVEEVRAVGFLWDWPTRTPQRVRTARAELVKAGRVEWSGDFGKSALGGKARTWRAV